VGAIVTGGINVPLFLRNSGGCDAGNEVAEGGAKLAEFLKMNGGQALDHVLPVTREMQFNATSIGRRRGPAKKPAAHQAVDQTNGAVVFNLKVVSQFSDERVFASGKSFQGEEGLVLLDGEPGPPGSFLAEVQENPQGMANGGKRLIVGFTEANRWHFLEREEKELHYIVARCNHGILFP